MEHEVIPPRQIRHPGGKNGMWESECSCGNYRTHVYATEAQAIRAVNEHIRGKRALLLSDMLERKLLAWLAARGVNAASADITEQIDNDYGDLSIELFIGYRLPNGEQGGAYYGGSLLSFIDELDALDGR